LAGKQDEKIQFKSLRFDEIRLYMIARVKNAQKN